MLKSYEFQAIFKKILGFLIRAFSFRKPSDSMESALGISAEERALSQIGQAVGPQQVFDPVTGDVRSAAERITAADISPIGRFRDAEG